MEIAIPRMTESITKERFQHKARVEQRSFDHRNQNREQQGHAPFIDPVLFFVCDGIVQCISAVTKHRTSSAARIELGDEAQLTKKSWEQIRIKFHREKNTQLDCLLQPEQLQYPVVPSPSTTYITSLPCWENRRDVDTLYNVDLRVLWDWGMIVRFL